MRGELDEINLTAYALGELEGPAREAVESRLANSAEDRRLVEEIRAAARLLSTELARESNSGLDAIHYAAIEMRLHDQHHPRPIDRRALVRGRIGFAMSVAASIAIIAGIFGFAKLMSSRQFEVAGSGPSSQPSTQTILIPLQDLNLGAGRSEHGLAQLPPAGGSFVNVAEQAVSSFAMNADTGSYQDVRVALLNDQLPSRESVRVEGLINAFGYELPSPVGDSDFAGRIEMGDCPWRSDCRLARIAIRARSGAAVVAEDATTQVTFNPLAVKSYRLIGYEDASTREPVGEEIAGGHAVTALYEVVPASNANPLADLFTLRVRYHRPGSTVERVIQFQGQRNIAATTSADFRFAAAVAEFAMVLHQSPDRGGANIDSAIQLAQTGRGPDASGERQQFIELARRAKQLLG